MLTLENVSVSYGAIEALTDINLQVNQGEVVTLIGANGAGKTTTLRTITSLLEPKQGRVMFEGKEISGVAAQNRTHSPRAEFFKPRPSLELHGRVPVTGLFGLPGSSVVFGVCAGLAHTSADGGNKCIPELFDGRSSRSRVSPGRQTRRRSASSMTVNATRRRSKPSPPRRK